MDERKADRMPRPYELSDDVDAKDAVTIEQMKFWGSGIYLTNCTVCSQGKYCDSEEEARTWANEHVCANAQDRVMEPTLPWAQEGDDRYYLKDEPSLFQI